MSQIIECVPNISEGNDESIIKKVSSEIDKVNGVRLLNVDIGKAVNRSVLTFAGTPASIVEAAFRVIKTTFEVIDMSKHKGEHPRMGATDVCPLVPVSGISMEETVEYAHKLAKRVGDELNLPVFCYEYAATNPDRKNLANVRFGGYEGLPPKLKEPFWKPDYGPAEFNPKFGAVAVGARDFLIAYNINLNTTSVDVANEIAYDIREKGRLVRNGNNNKGSVVKDEKGNPVYKPGALKCVKAIGWYIKEYGKAQISMNLTNINETSMHKVFEAVCRKAKEYGVNVTGSEIIGLVPLKALLDAGKHFRNRQKLDANCREAELIEAAVRNMGLDELKPFDANKKVIEYMI